eukprot:3827326-Amphidinium_carterae.4
MVVLITTTHVRAGVLQKSITKEFPPIITDSNYAFLRERRSNGSLHATHTPELHIRLGMGAAIEHGCKLDHLTPKRRTTQLREENAAHNHHSRSNGRTTKEEV